MTTPVEQAPPQLQQVATPPDAQQQHHTVVELAALIAAGATLELVTSTALALLAPFGYLPASVIVSVRLAFGVNMSALGAVASVPSSLPLLAARHALGIAGTHAVRAMAGAGPANTAAYVVAAAGRLQDGYSHGGVPGLADALRAERRFAEQHLAAQRRRLVAAAKVDAAAKENTQPGARSVVLGWYAHDDDRTTPECVEADRSNFVATRRPAIGWPGEPHGGTCRCWAGPPHATARSTYDVLPLSRAAHTAYDRAHNRKRRTA